MSTRPSADAKPSTDHGTAGGRADQSSDKLPGTRQPGTRQPGTKQSPVRRHVGWWGILLLAVFCLPLVGLFGLLEGFEPDYLPRLWRRIVQRYAFDTFGLLIGTAIGAGILGTLVAVGTSVFRFPGRKLVILLSFMPIAIPAYLVGFVYGELFEFAGPVQSALREIFGWDRKSDYWFPEIKSLGGGALIFSLVLFPYVFVGLRAALRSQLALVVEVGRTSGRGLAYSIVNIGVPLLWPFVFGGMLLASLEAVGDFGLVEYFGIDTMTFAIFDMWQNKGRRWAAAVIALLLLSIVAMVVWAEGLARARGERMTSGSFSKPPKKRDVRGGWGVLLAVMLSLPGVFGFLVPTLLLAAAMTSKLASGQLDLPTQEILSTFYIGLLCALLVATAVMLLQWQRSHRLVVRAQTTNGVRVLGQLLPLGYALPGLILALSIGWMFRGFDNASVPVQQFLGFGPTQLLSSSVVMVAYAYFIRFAAPASAAIRPGLARVTPSLVAASRIMGQNRWQRLNRVYAPMLAMPYVMGALVVFVEVAKELPIMLFLRSSSLNTLAVHAYNYGVDGLISQAAPAALLIVALGIVPASLIAFSQLADD